MLVDGKITVVVIVKEINANLQHEWYRVEKSLSQ